MKQVSVRQLLLIVAVLATASRMFMLPVLLIRTSGRDGIIVMTIHVIFEAAMLLIILCALKSRPNADLRAAVFVRFGKVGARIFFIVAAAYFFARLTLLTTQTALFFEHGVFEKFNWAVMMPVLLLFVTTAAGGSLRAISRTNELISPLIGVCLLGLLLMTAVTKLDYANVLPLFYGGGTAEGLLRTGSFVGDFTPLVFFIGKTDPMKKHSVWVIVLFMLIGSVISLYFILGICAVFGNMPHLVQFATNIANMHSYGSLNAAPRLDLVLYTIWSIAPVIATALTAYAATQSLVCAFSRVKPQYFAFAISVALYFLEVLVFNLDEIIFGLLTPYASIAMYALAFALPITACVCVCTAKPSKDADKRTKEKESVGRRERRKLKRERKVENKGADV